MPRKVLLNHMEVRDPLYQDVGDIFLQTLSKLILSIRGLLNSFFSLNYVKKLLNVPKSPGPLPIKKLRIISVDLK